MYPLACQVLDNDDGPGGRRADFKAQRSWQKKSDVAMRAKPVEKDGLELLSWALSIEILKSHTMKLLALHDCQVAFTQKFAPSLFQSFRDIGGTLARWKGIIQSAVPRRKA